MLENGLTFYRRQTDLNSLEAPIHEGQLKMELTDFSKPVLLQDDEKPESSDEDEGFVDILPEMKVESGDVDYEKYKEFYSDEIEGKMHR